MSRAIYVRSNATGVWTVHRDDSGRALSSHDSETAAELAALEQASRSGELVLVIDRYGRVHEGQLAGVGKHS